MAKKKSKVAVWCFYKLSAVTPGRAPRAAAPPRFDACRQTDYAHYKMLTISGEEVMRVMNREVTNVMRRAHDELLALGLA